MDMGKLHKFFRSVIQIILVTVCIVHICSLVYFNVNPKLPNIMKYKKSIEDIDFPISFIICINSNKGIEKVKEYGYLDEWNFFHGKSRFNNSIFGWAGHSEDGSFYKSAEGNKIFIFDS